jgi:hemolysin activation/secretion protein
MKIFIVLLVKFFLFLGLWQLASPVFAQNRGQSPPLNRKAQGEDSDSFYLKNIKVLGNTIFSQKEIENIIAPYLNKNLSFEQIRRITQKITDLYTSNGYLTSGAFFPEQEITDGKAIIQIIEGKLEQVEAVGLEKLKEKYLYSRLQWNAEEPINIKRLEESIQLLQQDPLIEKIDAKLVEGSTIGQSILLLNIKERSPWTANVTFNNRNSANSGELQGIASISNQNLLDFGDRLNLKYNLTEGFDAVNVGYTFPLAVRNNLSVEYSNGNSEITQSDFSDFGIRADAEAVSLQFDRSLVRQLNRDVNLFVAIDRRSSNTFIEDDLPLSFTEGPQDGRSRVTALRLGSSWSERSKTLVTSAQMRFSVGLDLFDATVNENAPDAIFFSWLGQLQLAKALNQKQDTLLVTRLAAQLTPDSLLPLEQIAVGGASTVRGYRENRGVADNGVFGTVELQLPLVRGSKVGDLNLVPFFDAGTVWSNDEDETSTLASLGLGVDWEIKQWFLVDLDWGIPLIEASDLDDSLQDKGLHFQLQFQPF